MSHRGWAEFHERIAEAIEESAKTAKTAPVTSWKNCRVARQRVAKKPRRRTGNATPVLTDKL